jgi:hypothetical protein
MDREFFTGCHCDKIVLWKKIKHPRTNGPINQRFRTKNNRFDRSCKNKKNLVPIAPRPSRTVSSFGPVRVAASFHRVLMPKFKKDATTFEPIGRFYFIKIFCECEIFFVPCGPRTSSFRHCDSIAYRNARVPIADRPAPTTSVPFPK